MSYQDFLNACERGDLKTVQELLKYPTVVNQITVKDNYIFKFTVQRGHLEIVKLLLKVKNPKRFLKL